MMSQLMMITTITEIAKEQKQDTFADEYFLNPTSDFLPVVVDEIEMVVRNNKIAIPNFLQ